MVCNLKRIAPANLIRSRCWYLRDAGFRARPSAPFCVDKKGEQNRLTKGLSSISLHGGVADLFHVSRVIGRRHRPTIAPPSALLTQKISRNTTRSSDSFNKPSYCTLSGSLSPFSYITMSAKLATAQTGCRQPLTLTFIAFGAAAETRRGLAAK